MRIGEMSQRTGVSIRMLRYFEEEKLIAPDRTESGYREYTQKDKLTIIRLNMLREAGLTLDIIKQILPCIKSNDLTFQPCPDLTRLLLEQMERTERRIAILEQNKNILSDFLRKAEEKKEHA